MVQRYLRTTSDVFDAINDKSIYKDSIVFIEDTKQIWTNGIYYASVNTEEVGDGEDIEGEFCKGHETPIVNQTLNVVEIQPNCLNVWGEMANLVITLATPADETIVNEYMFQFTSGDIATQLTLPDTITWMSEPTINANATYQISIINNLAVIGEFIDE